MSKVIIDYFSGTGNTAHCVGIISEQLKANGYEVTINRISKESNVKEPDIDYRIIAFPVLSWAAPVLVKRFIQQMPITNKTKIAILAVNGAYIKNNELIKGYTGQALEQIERIFRKKGYDVFLSGNASFPENWTQVTNPCTIEEAKIIYTLGEDEVTIFIDKFINKKTELYRCGLFNWVWSYLTSELFGILGRRALGKFFIADLNCTGCAICAKICPSKTIKMFEKKPHWSFNCEDCNRCINYCPEKAIQVSIPLAIMHLTINFGLTIVVILSILTYFPVYFDLPPVLMVGVEVFAILISYLGLLWLSFGPIDAFFRFILKYTFVRKLFSYSYTKKFGRYKATNFNPLKQEN